jgi:K+-sensing histidine kinase KdpD
VAGGETPVLGASALLLAAVSHDLRTPLAAAKAAVSGLRSAGIQ